MRSTGCWLTLRNDQGVRALDPIKCSDPLIDVTIVIALDSPDCIAAMQLCIGADHDSGGIPNAARGKSFIDSMLRRWSGAPVDARTRYGECQ